MIWLKLLLLLELRWLKSDTIMIMSMKMPGLLFQNINGCRGIRWYFALPSINQRALSYGIMMSRLAQAQWIQITCNGIYPDLHNPHER
jgi:hypothetical protein